MILEKFEQLLNLNEDYYIDFKSEMYFTNSNKDKSRSRAEFVKDIVSMCNTPRETESYIVIGVKNHNNKNELIGIETNNIPDDANLRNQFESLVSYVPKFSYDTISFNKKNFIVITIPVATCICIITKKFQSSMLEKDALYYREGSSNKEALKGSEKEREIYAWFRNKEIMIGSELSSYTPNERLISEMESFDSDKYFYFLITSPLNKTNSNLKSFGFVNWTFVMDFDPDSQSSGLLSCCKETLENYRSLHLVVKGESPSIHSAFGTYWYFSFGLSGRSETLLIDKKKKTWIKNYSNDFRKQIEKLSKALGNEKPVKILILTENNYISEYLNIIYTSLLEIFQENASFLLVSPEKYSSLETFSEENDIDILQMPLSHLCQIFENCQSNLNSQKDAYSIPSSSGTKISIDDKKIP